MDKGILIPLGILFVFLVLGVVFFEELSQNQFKVAEDSIRQMNEPYAPLVIAFSLVVIGILIYKNNKKEKEFASSQEGETNES